MASAAASENMTGRLAELGGIGIARLRMTPPPGTVSAWFGLSTWILDEPTVADNGHVSDSTVADEGLNPYS